MKQTKYNLNTNSDEITYLVSNHYFVVFPVFQSRCYRIESQSMELKFACTAYVFQWLHSLLSFELTIVTTHCKDQGKMGRALKILQLTLSQYIFRLGVCCQQKLQFSKSSLVVGGIYMN